MQHTGSTIIFEAYFHHGIKHLKKVIVTFYLTIRTNFLTSATFITHSEEFWDHISQFCFIFTPPPPKLFDSWPDYMHIQNCGGGGGGESELWDINSKFWKELQDVNSEF